MSLSKRLQTAERRMGRIEGCSVNRWYQTLTDEDRAEFDAWVEADLSSTGLHEACRAEGLPVGLSTFRNHIAGRCPCRGIRESV